MLYDREFALKCVEAVKNGETQVAVSKRTGVSVATLHNWIYIKIPRKREFLNRKEYEKNYYQTHKKEHYIRGLRYRLGSDVGLEVLKRDGHKCVSCGRKKNLVIHHIDRDKSNNTKNNLVTLCWSCHNCLHWVGYHPNLARLLPKLKVSYLNTTLPKLGVKKVYRKTAQSAKNDKKI